MLIGHLKRFVGGCCRSTFNDLFLLTLPDKYHWVQVLIVDDYTLQAGSWREDTV